MVKLSAISSDSDTESVHEAKKLEEKPKERFTLTLSDTDAKQLSEEEAGELEIAEFDSRSKDNTERGQMDSESDGKEPLSPKVEVASVAPKGNNLKALNAKIDTTGDFLVSDDNDDKPLNDFKSRSKQLKVRRKRKISRQEKTKVSSSSELTDDSSDEQAKPVPRNEAQKLAKSTKACIEELASTSDTSINDSDSKPTSDLPAPKKAKMRRKRKTSSHSEKQHILRDEEKTETKNSAGKSSKKPKETRTTDKENNTDKSTAKDAKGKSDEEHPRLAKLKRFCRAAGLHIRNYGVFFESCRTDKQKAAKLEAYLAEHGLVGRLSIGVCRKFKVKRENEREIAELDTNNILSEGRAKRRTCASLFASPLATSQDVETEQKTVGETKRVFSRLKGIVDSDEDGE